jgi:hypothetical protein
MYASNGMEPSSIIVLGEILGRRRSFCTVLADLPPEFLTYRAELSTHFLGEIDVCVLAVQPVIAERHRIKGFWTGDVFSPRRKNSEF